MAVTRGVRAICGTALLDQPGRWLLSIVIRTKLPRKAPVQMFAAAYGGWPAECTNPGPDRAGRRPRPRDRAAAGMLCSACNHRKGTTVLACRRQSSFCHWRPLLSTGAAWALQMLNPPLAPPDDTVSGASPGPVTTILHLIDPAP